MCLGAVVYGPQYAGNGRVAELTGWRYPKGRWKQEPSKVRRFPSISAVIRRPSPSSRSHSPVPSTLVPCKSSTARPTCKLTLSSTPQITISSSPALSASTTTAPHPIFGFSVFSSSYQPWAKRVRLSLLLLPSATRLWAHPLLPLPPPVPLLHLSLLSRSLLLLRSTTTTTVPMMSSTMPMLLLANPPPLQRWRQPSPLVFTTHGLAPQHRNSWTRWRRRLTVSAQRWSSLRFG